MEKTVIQTVSDESINKARSLFKSLTRFWTAGVFLGIILIFGTIQHSLFTVPYWQSTFAYLFQILTLSVGVTFVTIVGGMDLSVGAVEGFVGMATALIIKSTVPVFGPTTAVIFGCVIGMLIGVLLGVINGLIIAKMKLNSFIATLGTMGVWMGLGYLLGNGTDIFGLPSIMGKIGNHFWFGLLNTPALVSWIVVIIGWIALSQTKFGLYTFSIGSNHQASKRSGINTDRHIIKVYTLCSSLAALTGILMILRFNAASPITGHYINLKAIAAVVIGGTSLWGGSGTMFGTVIGSGIIAVLVTGLVLIGVQPFLQLTAIGLIIVVAVYLDQLRKQSGYVQEKGV